MKKTNNRSAAAGVILQGVSGAQGFAIGKASMYERSSLSVTVDRIEDDRRKQQLAKYRNAYSQVEKELQQMMDRQNDKNAEAVIGTQIAILRDPELDNSIERHILDKNQPADLAVQSAFDTFLSVMSGGGVSHEKGVVDITDVRDRLIQFLHGFDEDGITDGTILVAHELSPREVITCSEHDIKGIVMDRGGVDGHAAIVARSIGLPMILGTREATAKINKGDELVLDGQTGQVLMNIDAQSQDRYRELMKQREERLRDYLEICQKPNKTSDGLPFSLRANIEFEAELQTVKKYCAEGIGLLRTESIYLRRDFDDIDKQKSFYSTILKQTSPNPVTIRLFDAGGDKITGYESNDPNPFLGNRGIRWLLNKKELLMQQLRAICEVAANYHGLVRILIPMVSTLEEFKEVRNLLQQTQQELENEGISIDDNISLGIMVEVLNVALQADLFCTEADFLSIGTNDLTQYLLAVDRGNEQLSHLYDQRHPMVWRLIKNVVESAQEADKPLNVCGELASDPVSACGLMGLGITELSMNPAALPPVKKMLRQRSLSEMKQLATDLQHCQTISEVDNVYGEWKEK
ncbi:phosphoenolpyruvate--protein phosphotransferase [Fodinibius salinus]|uniref:Phosphoenolpyruvate-protein phosphotransferase n=1 Tax=Fodinibius salinus TaxID=860790 RepID=A0A5D3YEF4_9BACT|nr:phosphoenolpyruvate--protein phosphotransferase [Fodinibius salinus]TYP91731.1 phosphoenolpyruvate--protein phosphotransferase [Fodinibius salinus]